MKTHLYRSVVGCKLIIDLICCGITAFSQGMLYITSSWIRILTNHFEILVFDDDDDDDDADNDDDDVTSIK